MEERIKELIEEHDENVRRLNDKEKRFSSHIVFCQQHNFKEEERINLIKLEILSKALYPYNELLNDLKKLQNDWNS